MKIIKKKIKVLAFVYYSLILATVLLFSYAFYNSSKNFVSTAKTVKQRVIPTPIPNAVLNMDTLATMTHWQKGLVRSAKVTTESKGIIKKIDNDGGHIQEYDWAAFNYALKITLVAENGNWNDVFLNNNELLKTSFKQLEANGSYKEIKHTDLKENDTIEVITTIDLTKNFDNNFISAEIIRIL